MIIGYREIAKILSECGLGALLLSEDGDVLFINEAGADLLGGGKFEGGKLSAEAVSLCADTDKPRYVNISFGKYLIRCSAPELPDIPRGARLIVFREATNDACHDMLMSVLNQISESVILCDADSRVYLLNDAAVKMDSIVTQDVLGAHISDVYQTRDGTDLLIPRVIEEKRPIVEQRQYYTTRYGKNVDIVCNNFPIVNKNGQLLGGFSIMEDWSKVDGLHRQILDLQDKLIARSKDSARAAKNPLAAKYQFRDIIHISSAMSEVIKRCKRVAQSDSSVMIYGETGTGKELLAQSIHNASRRAGGPFMAINCAAIPENLLEGLLFGTEKGAFTGAERRVGLFEQANSGTLLLDEINSMNISIQSKLLRVIQEGVIRRVGGMAEIHIDVRILSNINIPPYRAIEENRLRQDLFFRLGAVSINIPPLRKRHEDIPLLIKNFILKFNQRMVRNVSNVDQETLELFYAYDWPGNVRELQHAIEHAMNIIPDDISVISREYIPEHLQIEAGRKTPETSPPSRLGAGKSLNSAIWDVERDAMCRALSENGGNISKSALALGMSRQNLQYRIKRYDIDVNAILKNKKIAD
jgi:arginine utilization regulatory protein